MRFVSLVTAGIACITSLLAVDLPQSQVRMPLAFEPNQGQAPAEVQWMARTADRTFLLLRNEAQMVLRAGGDPATIRMKLLGVEQSAQPQGIDRLKSESNYFSGASREWRGGVPHYGRVKYKGVYPGVDLVYYSTDRHLEYDFVVAPGADARKIQLAFSGAERIRIAENGDLVFGVNGRTMRQLKPVVYQNIDGVRREVAASYRLRPGNRVEFALARYDRSRELVIDPVLQYSTYFGQEGYDAAFGLTTDRSGNVYMTGTTTSVRYSTANQAQAEPGGQSDVFVAKFSGEGTLTWVTFVGGRMNDTGRAVAVDATGNVYVVGNTQSENFPVRNAPYGQIAGDFDAFLTKISPDGRQFLFSTFIGGTGYEDAVSLAVDAEGSAYVTGQTSSFDLPLSRTAFAQGPSGGGGDIFVTKISTTRANVAYSTYVGGDGIDSATGIAVDAQGNAYVSGGTTSTVFPVFGPIQVARRGDWDAFLFKLNPTGSSMVYSTYLGGSMEDFGYRVAVDGAGSAYVLGYTKSADFPNRSAFQTSLGGGYDAFVTKVNTAGTDIVYSTFLGGNQDDFGFGNIVVDGGGTAFISGYTGSTNFPTRAPFQSAFGGGRYDGFTARVGPQGSSLLYSSYLGGPADDYAYASSLDALGQLVVAGRTSSQTLPQVNNSFIGDFRGGFDIFLARVAADASINFVTANPGAVTFDIQPGATPGPQTIALGTGGAPLSFTIRTDQQWLRVSPDRGTTPATLSITIDRAALPANPTNTATIFIDSPAAANTALPIVVTATQTLVPVITGANPNPLSRGTDAASVTLTGSAFQNGLTVRVNGTTVTHAFVNPTTVQVNVPGSLRSTAEQLSFVIVNPDGRLSAPFNLPFAATTGPVVLQTGIVNAASGVAGPVAPGEIVTVFGTGFGPASMASGTFVNGALETSVGGARVLVEGIPAPILYARQNQLSAVIPYAIAGRESVMLEVEWAGQRSAPVRLTVGGANPGLFTQNSSGSGQAAAVNQDGSANSQANPAPVGSVVTLFATGEGVVAPSGAEGRMATTERPVQPVAVLLNGVPVVPEYVGASPGSVAGLLQLNLRVPAGLSGNVPVVLLVGGIPSQQGVTIAVR